MAFELPRNNVLEVVVSRDKALNMTNEQFAIYKKNPRDTNLLIFNEGMGYLDCTRFVLNLSLDYNSHKKLNNSRVKVKFGVKGQGKTADDIGMDTDVNLSYRFEEMRVYLKDIINPPDCENPLTFNTDSDGYASRVIVAGLINARVFDEIMEAKTNAELIEDSQPDTELIKKKLVPLSK